MISPVCLCNYSESCEYCKVLPKKYKNSDIKPYSLKEWDDGISGLTAPKSVLDRLRATIEALGEKNE